MPDRPAVTTQLRNTHLAPEPELIRALEEAAASDPENTALQTHLASLLLESGRPADALVHLERVLGREPDHVEALGLAARAAETMDDSRAAGWRRLYQLLAQSPTSTPPASTADAADAGDAALPQGPPAESGTTSERVVAAPDGETTDWDRFLQEILLESGHPERVSLSDVGGMTDVKERLEQSFLGPLRHPELRHQYGTHLRGGLLLWGPPGCGKTFLARAIAGEIDATFFPIGLHQVLDMWLGNSEKQLHEMFEMARRSTPSVLFFDELDAIGHSRMNLGRSAARNVVAQLLSELDGVEASNEGIFVIGATNQPWDVDPALRRPGRFDRTMLVLPPDTEARMAILEYHMRDRPLGAVDLMKVAKATDGMSGADLRLVCEDAAQRALGRAICTSSAEPIGQDDFGEALKAAQPTTSAWLASARNHVRYANDVGQYDELAAYLKQHRPR